MNPIKCYLAMAVILLIVTIQNCFATHPCVQVQVVNKQQLVAVPFALPVAVPVATVQPIQYGYSYQGAASAYLGQANYRSADDDLMDRLAAKLAARMGDSAITTKSQASPLGLAAQRCASCHAGPTAKGGWDLSRLETADGRLEAIARITADDPGLRMPKGRQLKPEEVGELIQSLSVKSVAAKAVPPGEP